MAKFMNTLKNEKEGLVNEFTAGKINTTKVKAFFNDVAEKKKSKLKKTDEEELNKYVHEIIMSLGKWGGDLVIKDPLGAHLADNPSTHNGKLMKDNLDTLIDCSMNTSVDKIISGINNCRIAYRNFRGTVETVLRMTKRDMGMVKMKDLTADNWNSSYIRPLINRAHYSRCNGAECAVPEIANIIDDAVKDLNKIALDYKSKRNEINSQIKSLVQTVSTMWLVVEGVELENYSNTKKMFELSKLDEDLKKIHELLENVEKLDLLR